eukprot:Skav219089  [mRNA]  locus=scaffold1574:93824:96882:+ [translate_table: standard]
MQDTARLHQGLSQDWLVEKFNLDLSLVARLGGHSQPRTHRGKERFPGMTITYALIQMLEKAWPPSLCGFGADFTSNSLLAQYRPDLLHLPTTNGEHCTGDGIKMGEALDPDGGSWPAYPSGKSWDEASGVTGSGKKFYHNIIPGSAVKSEPFYVAIITPVIHYCMGGLLIDEDSACIGANNLPIPGLYAAGEVAGGVHGNNRLGGNSLLDCVVFGRVAGKAAAKYMLGADMKDVDLRDVTGGGLTGAVESSKLAGGSYEDKMNSAPVPAAAAAAAPAAGGGGGFSLADVAKHNTKTDCWVVVDGQVLDVTSFLGEHPGGELAILTFAGKDATEEFNMRLDKCQEGFAFLFL